MRTFIARLRRIAEKEPLTKENLWRVTLAQWLLIGLPITLLSAVAYFLLFLFVFRAA